MTISKAALAALFAAGAILAAPIAGADEATTQTIGQAGELADGAVVQSWTITGLQPSSDVIPHAVVGTLWEATATNEAIAGSVTPIVSNFNARAADGENYRALFQVATPQGVNPSTLPQGQKTTGKLYFDVTGPTPDSVVYNAGGDDLLVWVKAAPAPSQPSGSSPATRPSAPTADTPAAAPTATPAPTAGSQGTPLAEGTEATDDIPTGSQGTPITEPTEGTAGTATTEEGTEGLEATEATEDAEATTTEAPTATPSPAPAGSQGTPITEGEAAPAATEPTGTPHGPQPAAPTTTAVPVPHGTSAS